MGMIIGIGFLVIVALNVLMIIFLSKRPEPTALPAPRSGTPIFTPDPSAWRSGGEGFMSVARILAQNNILGCGQMRWQPNTQQKSEYIVQCAPNGEYNVEYQVFTAIEKVEGPFRPGGTY
jgi:hypothetical protein